MSDSASSWRDWPASFCLFMTDITSIFRYKQLIVSNKAFQYLKGLFQADKKNMERMEERVPETEYDPFQYFLSDSKWDWQPLNSQIARDGDRLLGGHTGSSLYIDETGIPKKGKKSVGVARQWCGQIGKVDNCQVAVVASLGRGNFSLPIDFRLFLTEEWTKESADGAVGYAVHVGAKVAAPPGCPSAELCRCRNSAEISPSQKRYQRKGCVATAQSQTQEEAELN